jgi:multicomponent Na+:H+ antiporter subunit G
MMSILVDWLTAILLGVGSFFGLVAAIGIVRMPDLLTRMQAATKAATMSTSCIILANAVHFGDLGVTTRSVLVIAFLFLTVPIAAHMLGRTAYLIGVPLWEGTVIDEWRASGELNKVPPVEDTNQE